MLNIYYRKEIENGETSDSAIIRAKKIGGAAYLGLKDFLETHNVFFEEMALPEGIDPKLFGQTYLKIFTETDDSIILDGHVGPKASNDVYIHTSGRNRIPSGLVRAALEKSPVLLEVDHGPFIDDVQNQAYLEVTSEDNIGEIFEVLRHFIDVSNRRPVAPEKASVYFAVKDKTWHVKKKEIDNPKRDAYIIVPPNIQFGVPRFIEEHMPIIGEAIKKYNLDMRGVRPINAVANISNSDAYLFQYTKEANALKRELTAKGVRRVFALTSKKGMVKPHFLIGDAENSTITGATDMQNKFGNKYDAELIRDVQYSIMLNVLHGNIKAARELYGLFAQGDFSKSLA